MRLPRPAAATPIAILALFVALGGVSAAEDAVTSAKRMISGSKLKDGSVTARKIAPGTITGRQIKQGSLSSGDLAASLRGQIAAPGPAGPTGPKGDPGPNVVPGNGVVSPNVKDGSLDGGDVGRFVGKLNDLDFGILNLGTCKSVSTTSLTPIVPGDDLADDAIVVTPAASFPSAGLSVSAQPAAANTIRVTVCNIAGPPGLALGAQTFRFVTIDAGRLW